MADQTKVVVVITFNVTAQNIGGVLRELRHLLENTAPALRGFIDGVLLTTEDGTRVVLVANWESRDAWAQAEWDEQISRGVVELYEETASYDIKLFNEVTSAHHSPDR